MEQPKEGQQPESKPGSKIGEYAIYIFVFLVLITTALVALLTKNPARYSVGQYDFQNLADTTAQPDPTMSAQSKYWPIVSSGFDEKNQRIYRIIDDSGARDLTAQEDALLRAQAKRRLVMDNDQQTVVVDDIFYSANTVDYKPFSQGLTHETISKSALSLDGTREYFETKKYIDDQGACKFDCQPNFTDKVGEYVYDFEKGTLAKSDFFTTIKSVTNELPEDRVVNGYYDQDAGIFYYQYPSLDANGTVTVVDIEHQKLLASYRPGDNIHYTELYPYARAFTTVTKSNLFSYYRLPNLNQPLFEIDLSKCCGAAPSISYPTRVIANYNDQRFVVYTVTGGFSPEKALLLNYDLPTGATSPLFTDTTRLSADSGMLGYGPLYNNPPDEVYYLDENNGSYELNKVDDDGAATVVYSSSFYFTVQGYLPRGK